MSECAAPVLTVILVLAVSIPDVDTTTSGAGGGGSDCSVKFWSPVRSTPNPESALRLLKYQITITDHTQTTHKVLKTQR